MSRIRFRSSKMILKKNFLFAFSNPRRLLRTFDNDNFNYCLYVCVCVLSLLVFVAMATLERERERENTGGFDMQTNILK